MIPDLSERTGAEDEEKESQLDDDFSDNIDKKFNDIVSKEFTPEELKEMEESAADDSDDTEEDEKDELEENGYYKGGGRLSGRKKAAAGVAGGILGGGIIAFFVIMPATKLNAMLSQVDDRVMAITRNVVQKRINVHVERVLASKMIGYKDGKCGKVISKDCVVWNSSKGISKNLYSAWRDSDFESKLWDRLGIEIELDSSGQNYTLRDRMGRKITVTDGEIRQKQGGWLEKQGKNELAKELNKLIKTETKWNEVMTRKSLRKGFKYKYDIDKWCFLACKDRDKLRDKYNENVVGRYNAAKLRFKYKFIERVSAPMGPRYQIIFKCIAGTDSGCDREKIKNEIRNSNDVRLTEADIDDAFDSFNLGGDIPNPDVPGEFIPKPNSISEAILRKIIEKTISPQAARATAGAIPVIGWVYAGLSAIDLGNEVLNMIEDNSLGRYASGIAAEQYVQLYTAMQSNKDEMKRGKLSFAEVGAAVSEFDGSEQSKIYQSMQNIPPTKIGFLPKAYAEAEPYECRNGKPIPDDQYVCEEKKVAIEFFFEEWANSPIFTLYRNTMPYEKPLCNESNRNDLLPPKCPRAIVHKALEGVNWVISKGTETIFNVVETGVALITPGYEQMKEFAQTKLGEVTQFLMEQALPMPITADSPGRDKYDGLHGGGEVAAYEFNKGGYEEGATNGLGGVPLDQQQVNAIIQEENEQIEYENSNNSLYAKVFDVENSHSLINTTAMMMPTTSDGILNAVTSNATALFNGGLIDGFGRMLTTKASAYDVNLYNSSPFGVPRYGYPDEATINIDPDELTPERCEQFKAEREASKDINDVTGFDEYTVADPCLLEEVAMVSAGSLFTDAFDEDTSSGAGETTGGGAGAAPALDPNGFPTSPIQESDTAVTSNGIRLFKGIVPTVDAMIAAAAADGVSLPGSGWRSTERQIELRRNNCGPTQYDIYEKPSSQCSPQTARPGNSNHERGLAIDFSNMCYKNATCPPGSNAGYDWLTANAATFGFKKLSTEAWHWSVDGN